MAPKKSKAAKMSLNEFLGDSTLGSWADEMDALPSAPAIRSEDDRPSLSTDRSNRRDYLTAPRPDRSFAAPREDLPLPTQPPYTAFIGNLAFDITESELETFFSSHQIKSVKIIKDRDDKPKGFGYIEFADLDALKEALTRTGENLSGRTIRVSVAEPPKERSGFGHMEDDPKFSGSWRREAPLPTSGATHEPSRRRFDGPVGDRVPPPPSASDEASDWRSARPVARNTEPDAQSVRRRGSGFSTPEGHLSAADKEEHWSIGSKFKPALPDEPSVGKFGVRGRYESLHAKDGGSDEGEWRKRTGGDVGERSPSTSTPPTPQGRRRLELLPRSSNSSTTPSPLSSPKMSSNPGAQKSNPFGAAKPVDVSSKEREITTRLEKEREAFKERVPQHSMSRTSSKQATERHGGTNRTPPQVLSSPIQTHLSISTSANVRPSVSFASAASAKVPVSNEDRRSTAEEPAVEDATEQVALL
ncbi:hypothetical protein ID866_5761 [Astraeus odoratus]|nr:hypothetical protein ID866_5761 [Astraeus odoratus]